MKRILYLMSTDWGWIKQRPHFIAEGLSKYYSLRVVNSKVYKRKRHVKNTSEIKIHKLHRFPLERYLFIKVLNSFLYKIQLRNLIKNNDIIWFTSPRFFSVINIKSLNGKIVVYDIMDDILEFPENKKTHKKLKKIEFNECKLFQRADIVFTSATFLKKKIINRYGMGNIHIINNAIHPIKDSLENRELPEELYKFLSSKRIKLSYIGTISSWLDINLLLSILSLNSDIEILLFGPSEISLPKHERLKYYGALEHNYIFTVMNYSDAMIMPFVVNNLIKSVNPIKLYEYIYSNKPCFSVYYEELNQFKDYVYFYNNIDELQGFIDQLILNKLRPKTNIEKVQLFCSNNTWENRIDIIKSKLDSIKLKSNIF